VRESRDFLGEVDRTLIGRYAPPAAVINSNLEIVQFRGKTGMFLEPPSGAANLNILSMAREGLLPDLREAISKARRRDVRVRKEGVRVRSNGGFRTLNLEVVPLRSHGPQGRLYLVVFEPLAEKKSQSQRSARGTEPAGRDAPLQREVERLTGELSSTREYLQSMIEEQESTNEELKSANEEILSSTRSSSRPTRSSTPRRRSCRRPTRSSRLSTRSCRTATCSSRAPTTTS
jgi:two-component system CheB/CheR fusion protein